MPRKRPSSPIPLQVHPAMAVHGCEMPSNPVYELIYVSAATVPFDAPSLARLLDRARRSNSALDVTGMLIHVEGSFLQVLEGAEATVTPLFEKIEKDSRHNRVLRLFRSEKAQRSFGEWTMGYVNAGRGGSPVPGFNDFFRRGLADTKLDADAVTKARDIAHQFGQGRWRQHVSNT